MVEQTPTPPCPKCGSDRIESTCLGSLTPGHDPNTHTCHGCGHVWRPAKVNTHGVRFLPGYRNA